MFAKIFLLAAIQIGPFFEKRDDYLAVRPFYAKEESVTDIMWPLFTSHENWWRALLFIHYQENPAESSYQFSILPFWFNGKTRNGHTMEKRAARSEESKKRTSNTMKRKFQKTSSK